MSAVIQSSAVRRVSLHPPSPGFATGARRALVTAALVLGATILTLLMDAGSIGTTLRGGFADPDDAMRLVEVRAWLAGQSWFDVTAMRLDPPVGASMHWSRLVDLPTAAMIKVLGLVTGRSDAERLACVAVPALWLALLYLGVARVARRMVGDAGVVPALLGTLFSGAVLVQFGPGRTGHHAPETVALIFMIEASATALDPRRAWIAAAAGLLIALSLTMSLETLPFQAVLVGIIVLFWIVDGAALAAQLGWLASGLLIALPALYIATASPEHWLAPVCDAFGPANLGAGMVGAAGLLVLSRLTPRLDRRLARLGAAAAVGVVTFGFVAYCTPACLRGPFSGVDPLVRDLWLDHVTESLPLWTFLRLHPMLGLAVVMPVALGAAAALVSAIAATGLNRRRLALVAALASAGLVLSLWQVRVLTTTTPIALMGGVALVVLWRDLLLARGRRIAAAFAPAAILGFGSTAWAVALPADITSPREVAAAACLAPQAIAPLAALAPGSAVAPIESGAYLLEATRLDVFAAPYHRNNDGNRFAYDVWLAPPAKAGALLAARHVAYVIACFDTPAMHRLAGRAPDGLAALLSRGETPAFLTELKLSGTPYRAYAVRADRP